MIYSCCEEKRRGAAKESAINGLDYLEVLDADAPPGRRQQVLSVHFVNDKHLAGLTADNFRIEGGERVTAIQVTAVSSAGNPGNVLTVNLNRWGDFSTYTLRLIKAPQASGPPDEFDAALASIDFSFKVECPSDFDCRTDCDCPQENLPEPDIDYLAKDYGSFRSLILDRMAVLAPQWKERNPADVGMALIELLAYDGDSWSYRQDAVMTEAYFNTARSRISVRRHARLVDYFMHDGCNARTWVQLRVNTANVVVPRSRTLLTRFGAADPRIAPDSPALSQMIQLPSDQRPIVFETMADAALHAANNTLYFHTWGDDRCCLPEGATRASLKLKNEQGLAELQKGDVLIFIERANPQNGIEEEADPAHRHAVRLTNVEATTDPLFKEPDNPAQDLRVLNVEWADEDAIPFPLCLWDVSAGKGQERQPASIALGNIVLADHGQSASESGESGIGPVPPPRIFSLVSKTECYCETTPQTPVPARFRPALKYRPLTNAAPYDTTAPAAAAMRWSMRDVTPVLRLESKSSRGIVPWSPKPDLLNSGPDSTEFVVEAETNGTAFIRFGDGQHGKRPLEATTFDASYRVGNGIAGNVGADAIAHIISGDSAIEGVRNPMPASGGVEPESVQDVRRRAPFAFRTQKRAVTENDYAEVTTRYGGVQQAAATFRWTGSWHTVFVNVDRFGGLAVDDDFQSAIRRHLEGFRMAGHDLEVSKPRYVPLEIDMFVCVKPDYFRSHVKEALRDIFSSRTLPDGQRGVFHPDNFTFGQPVYLSSLYAAAQNVDGVSSVEITAFQRMSTPDPRPLQDGKLAIGRLEIARLDNDPSFPERGVFRLTLGGGK